MFLLFSFAIQDYLTQDDHYLTFETESECMRYLQAHSAIARNKEQCLYPAPFKIVRISR